MIICFRSQQILLCLKKKTKHLISVICCVGEKMRAIINFTLSYLITCVEYSQVLSVSLVAFIVKTQPTRLKWLGYLHREWCFSTALCFVCVDVNGLALK